MAKEPKQQERVLSPSEKKKSGRAGLGMLSGKKGGLGNLPGKKKETLDMDNLPKDIQLKLDDDRVIILTQPQEMKTGGRAGYKMGSKCKIATKGKGRAYGKNS